MSKYDDIMAQDGELAAIQVSVRDLVRSFDALQGITILHEQARDLQYMIDQAIADIGICATVLTVSADDDSPGVPELMLDNVYVVIEIREDVLINRAETGLKIPASKVADIIGRKIKQGMATTSVIGPHTLVTKKLRMVPGDRGEEHLLIWHVICQL